MAKIETTLEQVLKSAKTKGADSAEVILTQTTGLSASVREGQVEDIQKGTSQNITVKVYVDGKTAVAVPASLDKDRINAAIEGAIRSAKTSTSPNPHDRLAKLGEYASKWKDLELCDNSDADLNGLINMASEAEDAAMSVEGVAIANGASAGQQRTKGYFMTSEGFSGSVERTANYFRASVVAERGGEKQVGSEGDNAIFVEDLKDPVEIGRKAGEDAAGKLGSVKPKSAKVPVIFDPDMAAGLLRHFATAVNGQNVALKQTFLANSMGKKVFGDNISIINDPTIRRGMGSEPFDDDGMATKRAVMIEDGVLQRWFMDIEDAGRLGLKAEGVSGIGNLHMLAGKVSPEDLMADIKDGFYVTGLMSQGADTMTGDYSRAASGFWIKDGQIAFPVSQVVIASNMKDMFREMIPANDFTLNDMRHRSVAAPTVRIPQMTVSGS